jgi:hypothetical protein
VVGGAALGLLTAIVFNLTWLRRRGAVLGVVWIAAVAWTAVKVQSLSLTWNADTVAQTAPEPSIRPGPIQGGVGATAPSNQSAPGGVPTRFYLDNRKTNLEILDKRLLLQEYQNLQSAKQHQRDLALQTESYADDYKRRAEEHRSEAEELHRLASALDSRAHEYAIDGNSQLSSETSDEAREAWSKATAHERDADTCRTQERRYRNEAAEYRRQQAAYEQRYQEIQSQL